MPDDLPRETEEELDQWRGRCLTAEADLDAMRADIREFVAWLREPTRGPVIFRIEVIERLREILEQ